MDGNFAKPPQSNRWKKPFFAALLGAIGFVSYPAHGQLVTNGDFETGDLTGWVPYATTSGTAGIGFPTVSMFDTSQTGSASNSAEFQVGSQPGSPSGTLAGAGLEQTVTLTAGDYILSAAIATNAPGFGNSDAGTFTLLFDGAAVASFSMGPIGSGKTKYPNAVDSIISGSLTGVAAGPHQIAIQVERTFVYSAAAPYEYFDNVTLTSDAVPEPSAALALMVAFAFTAGAVRYRRVHSA